MIITLPEAPGSGSDKAWIKRLDRVDRRISTGYCFEGAFQKWRSTIEVDPGTFFLAFHQSRSRSGNVYFSRITLYRAQDDSLIPVEEWKLDGDPGWALKVRDAIADIIEAQTPAPEAPQAPWQQYLADHKPTVEQISRAHEWLMEIYGPADGKYRAETMTEWGQVLAFLVWHERQAS